MIDKATKRKIEELEACIKQLEARPVYIPYPVYTQPYQQPSYPRYPWWTPTWTGGAGGSAGTTNTVKYDPTVPSTLTVASGYLAQ